MTKANPLARVALMTAVGAAFAATSFLFGAARAEADELAVGMLWQKRPPPDIYDADPPPDDEGIAGGQLAIKDTNTTGRLIGMSFKEEEKVLEQDDDPIPPLNELLDAGIKFIITSLPSDKLLKVSDAVKGKDVVLLNAGNADDRLRQEDCRANVFHVAPSRAMLTDALAQFLVFKRWRKWMVVYGPHDGDKLYADALRNSAKKFAAKVTAEKLWEFGPDGRRTAQQEVPLFTQGLDYDVVVIADEAGEFGQYVEFHTWDPRPTAGTAGLSPVSWDPAAEQNGAVQLNNRFKKLANRKMNSLDFNAWLAVRAVTETSARLKSTDYATLRKAILSPELDLAGFKGVGFSFRDWDQQLRQPILLASAAALVSMSPQPGFLHQRSILDTLGVDKPESKCKLQ
ncbi:ABC transporter substrate-binding protein [Methyloraptor flagellatus]|uniref:ABC transporter substrate-binding protein n=1 Tax=Methyloraptor flagellatus TaxID=3162530 RepID=A0AAU7XBE1_9HYPH